MSDPRINGMVKDIFVEFFEVKEILVRPEATLFDDLGLDSMDMVDLAVELQARLDKVRVLSNGFQTQMEEAKVASIKFQGETENAKAQTTVAQTQLNKTKADMVQLQTQLDESKALVTDLQAKLTKAEAENALLRKPPAKK